MSRRLILIYVVFLVTTIFRFRTKVTPLDLLAQVAGTLGDNRRFYLTGWLPRFCTNNSPPQEGDCLYRHNALGWIIEMPINLLA